MPYAPDDILLDKYRIEALLGQGAFGDVYRVTHLRLNVPRALKVLRRDAPGVGSTEFNQGQQRFQLEAQLGAKLNSPNPNPHLLQVHDFINTQDLLVLEMEYAPGGNLAECLLKYKDHDEVFPINDALQIAADVAAGLGVLHAMDIVHRDLKPANILFDQNGHARLADLGLAQIPGGPSQRSQLSTSNSHPGTPGYMSPEQRQSSDILTPPSDIFSLGLVLFEILTGRNYSFLRPGIRASAFRAELPSALDNLLGRMLSDVPKDRPWDGKEAVEFLREVQRNSQSGQGETASGMTVIPPRGKPVPLRTGKPDTSATGKPKNRSTILVGSGALFLLLTIFVAVIISRFVPKPESYPLTLEPLSTVLIPSNSQVTDLSPENNPPPAASQPMVTATFVPGASESSVTASADLREISDEKGVKMRLVQAGEFEMGGSADLSLVECQKLGGNCDRNWFTDAEPLHKVTLDAFYIDIYEVTNVLYKACVDAGACIPPAQSGSYTHPSYFGKSQFNNYPVIYVNWYMAKTYCEWRGARLPSEAEWEKAARGTNQSTYPWGNGLDCSYANYGTCNSDPADTVSVGSFGKGASYYGIYDMAGNVWEWVADWYDPQYYKYSPSNNPSGPVSGEKKVLRGGGFYTLGIFTLSSNRGQDNPNNTLFVPPPPNNQKKVPNYGFRCAR